MHRIYLDHNATGPPLPEARAAVLEIVDCHWANPSSPHAPGRAAREVLETARRRVARLAGVEPAAVFFTSGGTEAGHAALRGVARAAGRRERVVISGLEHACIRQAARRLAADGFEIDLVPPGSDGLVDASRFLAACNDDTVAAALLVAHNEIGTLQPVAEVATELAARGVPLVADGVQAAGRLERPHPAGDHVLGMLAAHKIGGYAGAGAVIAHPDRLLVPLVGGGEQERGRRGGTPALALIAAMGAAAEVASRRAGAAIWGAVADLRDRFEAALLAAADGIRILGANGPRLPNTSAFLADGVVGEDLVAALDLAGIAVSSGSACATGSSRASESLLAMGLEEKVAQQLVRVSLGPETTAEEMECLADATRDALARLRRHAGAVS